MVDKFGGNARSLTRLVPTSISPSAHRDALVNIVVNDASARDAVSVLLQTRGLRSRTFETAEAFLDSLDDTAPVCAVVEVCLPGMNGFQLQQQLAGRMIEAALIILTGQASVRMAVEAMRSGALHFIEKPLDPETMLEALDDALVRCDAIAEQSAKRDQTQARLKRLTPREREVLALLVDGHLNKVIARRLGISTRTAEHHRAHIMAKMEAPTFLHLIRSTLVF